MVTLEARLADVFVGIDWLGEHLDDPTVVAVDVRQPFFYTQAHIPGAVTLPLMFLSSPQGGVVDPETLARSLRKAGIAPDTHVVAYDEGASNSATRLYWLLNLYGHSRASVLDGGVTAWRHAGYDWAYEQTHPTETEYPVPEMIPGLMESTGDMMASLDRPDRAIIDTRSPGEYLGTRPAALRNGHIPGAVNVDWSANLREQDAIALTEEADQLRHLYAAAGATPDKVVTVYCASGMRASYTFAVLKSLGYPNVAMYVPGWNEWGNRHDTPVEDS
jgi:thiosulfate/3-mercaptopyruvate sulfurtransferase